MSIYTDCSQAVRDLMEEGKFFTEIEIIDRAAKLEWGTEGSKFAMTEANMIVSTLYREGRLVRYGLVQGDGRVDYARRASKIVHADATKGPAQWETPNGTFKQIHADHDPVRTRAGRRAGTNRDDSRPWEDSQSWEVMTLAQTDGNASGNGRRRNRVQDLEQELEAARQEIAQLQEQITGGGELPVLHAALSEEALDRIAEAVMPKLSGRFEELWQKTLERMGEALTPVG